MSHPFQHALIMAAGRGTRMRPFSDVMPKAMFPYKGDTLVGNSLKMLSQCVAHVHITVGYKSAMLVQHIGNLGVSSIFNTEGHPNSWWTHHTVMRYVDSPVVVLTCDNIIELDFDFLARDYFGTGSPVCMVVPVVPVPGIEGDYIDHEDGFVTRIQREDPTPNYCSGIQILNPARVASLTQGGGNFYSIWNQLIAQRQLRVSSVYPNKWYSIDTLEQLLSLPD